MPNIFLAQKFCSLVKDDQRITKPNPNIRKPKVKQSYDENISSFSTNFVSGTKSLDDKLALGSIDTAKVAIKTNESGRPSGKR